jgi:threonine/homoserine/homoserine lactone efflux protein
MIVETLEILIGGLCVGLASSVTVGPVAVLCIQRTLSKGYLSGILSGLGVAVADTLMAIMAFTLYALLKEYIDTYNTIIMSCGGIFVIIVGIFIFLKNPVPQVRKNRTGKTALWQDFGSMFGFTLANFAIIIPYVLAFFTMFNIELAGSDTPTQSPEPITESVMVAEAEATAEGDILEYDNEAPMALAEVQQADEDSMAVAPETEVVAEGDAVITAAPKIPYMVRNILTLVGFLAGAMVWWVALTSIINLFRRNFQPQHLITINRIAGIIISALGTYTLLSVIIDL